MDRPAGADEHRAGQRCVHGRGGGRELSGAEECWMEGGVRNRLVGAARAAREDDDAAEREGGGGDGIAAAEQVRPAHGV